MKLLCCVMFKNEEEILRRCLDSLVGIVDGYLLVDTGSTDNSINIAKEYTEHVYEIEFEDFVISKNKVLEYAYDLDYDYILWMDADEYLAETDKFIFKKQIEKLIQNDNDMLITRIQDLHNEVKTLEYDRPRIWKNKKDIRFEGPGIHEYIPFSDNYITNRDIKIVHKHKTKGKDHEATIKFYLEILHKYYDKDPKNIRCLFYLARTYFDINDERCVTYYEQYRNVCNEINYFYKDEYFYTYYDQGRLYSNLGNYEKAIEYLKQAIEYLPTRAEAYITLANIYFYNTKDNKKAKEILEKATSLEILPEMILFIDEFSYKYKVYDLLSLVYWELQEYQKGYDVIMKLLALPKINQYDFNSRIRTNLPWFENKINNTKVAEYDINRYFDNIFIINLERRTDRWNKVKTKLDDLGINYEKFRGYEGKLFKDFVDKNIFVRRTGGYMGCLMSHLEVMQIALDRGYEKILILEDDLAIHKDIHKQFNVIMSEVERNGNSNWDLLYLGHASFYENYNLDNPYNTFTPIVNEHRKGFVWEAVNCWTTHAWALNRKAMQFIVDYYNENPFLWEIDKWVASELQGNDDFKCLAVYPQLFVQNDIVSDNDDTGESANHFDRFLNRAYSNDSDYI